MTEMTTFDPDDLSYLTDRGTTRGTGQQITASSSKRTLETKFDRVPDDSIERMRRDFRALGVPEEDYPKVFLQRIFAEYSMNVENESYMLVSDALAGDATQHEGSTGRSPAAAKAATTPRSSDRRRSTSSYVSILGGAESRKVATFTEAAEAVKAAWGAQRTGVAFDDTIFVVMLSPRDPDDYIALGAKRLYWLDDDVTTKEHKNGLLHAIEYFDSDNTAPAPDGREWRKSEEGARLSSYLFRVSRQFDVVADGGDVSDIWPLPYRGKERSQLDASRVCLLLNELREFLHPGSSAAVLEAAELCDKTLHLRIITKDTKSHHLKVATQHGKNCRLLDEDGQPHALWKRIDGPPPYGINYQLGTGTAAYFEMLWYLGWGFLAAFIVSLPQVYLNATGGRFSNIGVVIPYAKVSSSYYASIYSYDFMIGNRNPYDLNAIYPIFDFLVTAILVVSFAYVFRKISKIEENVDEGQATAEDYSVVIEDPPPSLGAGGPDSGVAAVRAYSKFFRNLCRKDSAAIAEAISRVDTQTMTGSRNSIGSVRRRRKKGFFVPSDDSISEVVIVKTNAEYLRLRREVKRAHREIEASVSREQRYKSEAAADPKYLEKLHANTEAAIEKQKKLVEQIEKEVTTKTDVAVSAVFVSFNTAAARDKVLHELRPKNILLQLMPWRNIWPYKLFCGEKPNFEYDDPLNPGKTIKTFLRVTPAREVGDYIWPHTCLVHKRRRLYYYLGWLWSLVIVGLCTALAVHLLINLLAPIPYTGTFTLHNSLCNDPFYLRYESAADVQASCGLDATSLSEINTKYTADLDADPTFGRQPSARYNEFTRDLFLRTPCSPRAGIRESNVVRDDARFFKISDVNHTLLPECAFLNESFTPLDASSGPASAGTSSAEPLWQRGFENAGFDHSGWRVYCNYGVNQTIIEGEELRMEANPYCADAEDGAPGTDDSPAPFKVAGATGRRLQGDGAKGDGGGGGKGGGGGARRAGLVGAISAEECGDTNCLRCLALFNQCYAASRVYEGKTSSYFGFSFEALLSYANMIIILLFAQLLYYVQQYLSMYGVSKPNSHTQAETDFMIMMEVTLIFFVLFVVVWVYTGSGSGVSRGAGLVSGYLGFAAQVVPQVWSYIVMYGWITMWWCFGGIPPLYNIALRLLGKILIKVMPFPTQELVNFCYEGYPFLHHYAMSFTLFVVLVCTGFSTILPLGLFICATSLLTRYLMDRVLILYVYQRPPPVDTTLVKFFLNISPIGIIGKGLFMVYTYRGIIFSGESLGVVVTVIGGILCVTGVQTPDFVLAWFGKVAKDHSQHKDAANFSTHQDLVRRGLISSYDPLDEVQEDSEINREKGFGRKTAVPRQDGGEKRRSIVDGRGTAMKEAYNGKNNNRSSIFSERELSRGTGEKLKNARRRSLNVSKLNAGESGDARMYKSAKFDALLAVAEVVEQTGTVEELVERATSGDSLGSAPSGAGIEMADIEAQSAPAPAAGLFEQSAWRPFIWRNPGDLPIVAMCPNSGEAARVKKSSLTAEHISDQWGTATWGRSSRLSGADEAHFFKTYQEMRTWIDANLRVEVSAGASPISVGTPGLGSKGNGEATLYMYTGLPVSILAPTTTDGKWLLTVCRDRGEFPELRWKILEAESRREFHTLLQQHGCDEVDHEGTAETKAEGDVEWEVQALAAELCDANDSHGFMWTRWVAVLRAGSTPPTLLDVHTNVKRGIEWGIADYGEDDGLAARLQSGQHLIAIAGTEPKLNARCMAWMHKVQDWSEQYVHSSPRWPEAWLATEAPKDMLISSATFHNHSWSLVLTHASNKEAMKMAGVKATAAVEQEVLVETEWPEKQLSELLSNGYTITCVGRGPDASKTSMKTVYVIVLTRSPSMIIPRNMRSFGSCESLMNWWRAPSKAYHKSWTSMPTVSLAASQTLDAPADLIEMRSIVKKGPKHHYRKPGWTTMNLSAVNTLDQDLGTWWSSGKVEPSAVVTLTIDLGESRLVDEIGIFWGDFEPLPMPKSWELVGSTSGSVADGPASDGTVILKTVEDADLSQYMPAIPYENKYVMHKEDLSCSFVKITPPKELKVIQIKLKAPQQTAARPDAVAATDHSARAGYAIRLINVVGPGPSGGAVVPEPEPDSPPGQLQSNSSEIGASVGVSYTENYAGEPPSNPASPPSEDGEPRVHKGGMWKPGERPTTIESVSDDEHE